MMPNATPSPAPTAEPSLFYGLLLFLWVILGLAAMVAIPIGGLYALVRFVKWAWTN